MIYLSDYYSPVGKIIIAGSSNYIIGLWFEGQNYFMNNICSFSFIKKENLPIKKTKFWLDDYFNKIPRSIFKLPLLTTGTHFRIAVWNILMDIPYGELRTYGDIAKIFLSCYKVNSMSCRAIGSAVGHNPISIIIPCHRIVGANNKLTGYSGGIERKIALLKHEGINTNEFCI